jgi:hypothetical protein
MNSGGWVLGVTRYWTAAKTRPSRSIPRHRVAEVLHHEIGKPRLTLTRISRALRRGIRFAGFIVAVDGFGDDPPLHFACGTGSLIDEILSGLEEL